MIGYNKSISPKTPEQLQSSSRLARNDEIPSQSKSINGSANRPIEALLSNEKEKAKIKNFGQKLDIQTELRIGQDINNPEGLLKDTTFSKSKLEADSDATGNRESSIFTSTPFRDTAKQSA